MVRTVISRYPLNKKTWTHYIIVKVQFRIKEINNFAPKTSTVFVQGLYASMLALLAWIPPVSGPAQGKHP